MELTLVNLDSPAETRSFEKGRFELYRIGALSLHIMGSETYAA